MTKQSKGRLPHQSYTSSEKKVGITLIIMVIVGCLIAWQLGHS